MTLTPERLAELRKHAETDWVNSGSCRLSIGDLDDLLAAADNLAALLAAAEDFRHTTYKRWNPAPYMDGERWPPSMKPVVDALDAAIRRAKGEQP